MLFLMLILFVLYSFFQICTTGNVAGTESDETYLKHLVNAYYKYTEALIYKCFAESRQKHSGVLRQGQDVIIDFREYIFNNYNLNEKEVDECIYKRLKRLETSNTQSVNCRQNKEYVALRDEIFSKVINKHVVW